MFETKQITKFHFEQDLYKDLCSKYSPKFSDHQLDLYQSIDSKIDEMRIIPKT